MAALLVLAYYDFINRFYKITRTFLEVYTLFTFHRLLETEINKDIMLDSFPKSYITSKETCLLQQRIGVAAFQVSYNVPFSGHNSLC